MSEILYLDAESYSEQNIRSVGAPKYVRDKSTEVLLWAYAFNDEPVRLWDLTEDPMGLDHGRFIAAFDSPEISKVAFNSPFDRGLIVQTMRRPSPLPQWFCARVLAYSLSFTGGLDDVLQQIGFPANKQKNKDGKALINRFCSPAPQNHKADRYTKETHPEEWERFRAYAAQDVIVLRELWTWLMGHYNMSREEWGLWRIDQHINEAGVPIDVGLCRSAMAMHRREKHRIKTQLTKVTGLDNPLSNAQMRKWLEDQGCPLPNLQKETIRMYLDHPPNDYNNWPAVSKVLDTYSKAVQTAPTKWKAFLSRVGEDNRLRGAFQFAGASRTRRWAGRGVQLQNLRRGPTDECVSELIAADADDMIRFVYGEVMTPLASSVRSAITAPDSLVLNVCDLSSIESVILGWFTDCTRINDIFRSGKDTYKDFATILYQISYEEVTKAQRTFCKPPVLGCGYRLGWRALINYADNMGVKMTNEEAKYAVRTFRENYPEIPKLWYWLDEALKRVVLTGKPESAYKVRLSLEESFLFITLPSGRRLAYYKPLIEPRQIQYEDEDEVLHTVMKDSFTYMGVNRFTQKWGRVSAHGGLITENIVQAAARDILAHGIKLAFERGLEIVGHVHDEIIVLSKPNSSDFKTLRQCMISPPPWVGGMWLGADGYTAKRYRKD